MEDKQTRINNLKNLLKENSIELKALTKSVFVQKSVFVELDENKNGILEMEEFEGFFRQSCIKAQIPYDLEVMKTMFEEWDKDKNGTIDLEEMTEYLKDLLTKQLQSLEAN